ncbi:hypothetical protein [Sporisorium scitamineum]|nr:hypothetical protein [Sporisorium scitamineum]
MRRFPEQPLPFPVATYRDFFVLVSQWRHKEGAIDARHTIDSTRRWIELSSASERAALDQGLDAYAEVWNGPFELTSRLLVLLMVLHTDGETCVKEVDKVARLLIEALDRAAGNSIVGSLQRLDILVLLGILIDSFAEFKWQAAGGENGTNLVGRAVRLLVNSIWRDHELVKVAIGILNRIVARDASFTWILAADTASAILSGLSLEIECRGDDIDFQNAGPLVSVTAIFRDCLGMMLESCYEDTIGYIANALFEPLSCLLSRLLERTIEAPADEHTAELDKVATMLYDICDKALHGQPI